MHRILKPAPSLNRTNHPCSVLHLRATDDRRTGTCADLENERQKNLTGNPKDSLLLCSSIVPTDYPPCSPRLIPGPFVGLSRRTRQKSPEKLSLHFPKERTYTNPVMIVA